MLTAGNARARAFLAALALAATEGVPLGAPAGAPLVLGHPVKITSAHAQTQRNHGRMFVL
jgi:hypothetical protein